MHQAMHDDATLAQQALDCMTQAELDIIESHRRQGENKQDTVLRLYKGHVAVTATKLKNTRS